MHTSDRITDPDSDNRLLTRIACPLASAAQGPSPPYDSDLSRQARSPAASDDSDAPPAPTHRRTDTTGRKMTRMPRRGLGPAAARGFLRVCAGEEVGGQVERSSRRRRARARFPPRSTIPFAIAAATALLRPYRGPLAITALVVTAPLQSRSLAATAPSRSRPLAVTTLPVTAPLAPLLNGGLACKRHSEAPRRREGNLR